VRSGPAASGRTRGVTGDRRSSARPHDVSI
jgi:hypothetical protein